jgi:hypothetical protein
MLLLLLLLLLEASHCHTWKARWPLQITRCCCCCCCWQRPQGLHPQHCLRRPRQLLLRHHLLLLLLLLLQRGLLVMQVSLPQLLHELLLLRWGQVADDIPQTTRGRRTCCCCCILQAVLLLLLLLLLLLTWLTARWQHIFQVHYSGCVLLPVTQQLGNACRSEARHTLLLLLLLLLLLVLLLLPQAWCIYLLHASTAIPSSSSMCQAIRHTISSSRMCLHQP